MMKNYDYILFDLDGTLLRMNQDEFTYAYFEFFNKHVFVNGIDTLSCLKIALKKMLNNNGLISNKDVFWNEFNNLTNYKVSKKDVDLIYQNYFDSVRYTVSIDSDAVRLINDLKKQNKKLILATNPIFPKIATFSRISWAGLNKDDFIYVTTYENSSFCKPNINYYKQILNKFNIDVNKCLMVGNDTIEDLAIKSLGVDCFLLTKDLINKNNFEIENVKHGSFDELRKVLNLDV